jgi:hypothetical protein
MHSSSSTNPFLAMLAVVEENWSQTEPTPNYNVEAGNMKSDIRLPEFWLHATTFLAKCIFTLHHMEDQITRYVMLLDILQQVADLLNNSKLEQTNQQLK